MSDCSIISAKRHAPQNVTALRSPSRAPAMVRMMPLILCCACAEVFTSCGQDSTLGRGGSSALMMKVGTGASTPPCSTSKPQAGPLPRLFESPAPDSHHQQRAFSRKGTSRKGSQEAGCRHRDLGYRQDE